MARVDVFPFKVYDAIAGAMIPDPRLATREHIRSRGADIIERGICVVDERLVDKDGRLLLDPSSLSAAVLKELYATGGHDAAPPHLNAKEMATLVDGGLVNGISYKEGLIIHDITDLGRQFVRDLLS